ncbi:MAG: hypothetical protein AAFN12_05200, partial [Cyanobacteria bacterium J06560_2]
IGLLLGLFGGLIGELFLGLLLGLLLGLFLGLTDVQPKEQLKFSLRKSFVGGLIGGLLLGLFGGLLLGLFLELRDGLIVGLRGGLIGFLTGGIGFGLINKTVEQKRIPNQGIKRSLQNGLIFGPISGLTLGLILGAGDRLIDGLIDGLMGGLAFGLILGAGDAIKHVILRLFLTKNGDTPWNYAQFLEHAARHRFIQRTGGRYRFVHDLLRQHFADMTPQQQAILAQGGDVTNQANP